MYQALLVLGLLSAAASAQTVGEITGEVKDASGADPIRAEVQLLTQWDRPPGLSTNLFLKVAATELLRSPFRLHSGEGSQ
jgi:hypothetical protein